MSASYAYNELVPGHCWEQISGLSACWGEFQHMHFGRALTDDRYYTQTVPPLSNSLVGKGRPRNVQGRPTSGVM